MAINLIINGISYPYPENADEDWGYDATNWAAAVSNSTLQKVGGLFTLTDTVDFGADFGLITKCLSSRDPNVADAGIIRLSSGDTIEWRNTGNTANNTLGHTNNVLEWNGDDVITRTTLTAETDLYVLLDGSRPMTGTLTIGDGVSGRSLIIRESGGDQSIRFRNAASINTTSFVEDNVAGEFLIIKQDPVTSAALTTVTLYEDGNMGIVGGANIPTDDSHLVRLDYLDNFVTNPMTSNLDTAGWIIKTIDKTTAGSAKRILLYGGAQSFTGGGSDAGHVLITAGEGTNNNNGGRIDLFSGDADGATAAGGDINIKAGRGTNGSDAGDINITAGFTATGTTGVSGTVTIKGGNGTGTSAAGDVYISGGGALFGLDGGKVIIEPGADPSANGAIEIHGPAGQTLNAEIDFYKDTNGAHTTGPKVTFGVPQTLVTDANFLLPIDNGTPNYILETDGSGNTGWVVNTGGVFPAVGDLTDVVYGSPAIVGQVLTYDGVTWQNLLPVTGVTDHDLLSNNGGAGSHAVISSHIADSTIHFSQSDITVENGFVNRTSSTISFGGSPRTFTIDPAGSPAQYDYWSNGVQYTETISKNVVIDNSEGIHAIYFDGATLVAEYAPTVADFENLIIPEYAFVAFVYWSVSAAAAVMIGDERHGRVMDSETHLYLHNTKGTAYQEGLSMVDMTTDGNGSLAAHAQAGYAAGIVWDEDIKHESAGVAGGGTIPIFYRDGVGGNWLSQDTTYTVLFTTRALYNLDTGGTWSTPVAPSTTFVLTHYFATGDIDNPVIAIMGQNWYLTEAAAQVGAATEIRELALGGLTLLTPEFKSIATVINQTDSGYTNAPNTRTISTSGGDDFVDWRLMDDGSAEARSHEAETNPHNNWVSCNSNQNFSTGPTSSSNSIAIGDNVNTNGSDYAFLMGRNVHAPSFALFNIGIGADVYSTGSAIRSTAIGFDIIGASGENSVIIGSGIVSTLDHSVLMGSSLQTIQLKDRGTLNLTGNNAQFVQPSYTTAGLPTGVLGGTVYDTTTSTLKVYTGTWQDVSNVKVLDDLNDVVLTGSPTLVTDDVLVYNGANWVNAPKTSVGVLDHVNLLSIGNNTHTQIDSHISDTTIHFDQLGELSDVVLTGSPTLAADHLLIYNGANWVQTPKTEVGVVSHNDLTDIGSNSHATIDTHISAYNPHNNWMSCDNNTNFPSAASGAGANAIAIGNQALASATDAIAIGNGADCLANQTIVIGNSAYALGILGVAIGHYATINSTRNNCIAIGATAIANADYAVVIGSGMTNAVANSFMAGSSSSNAIHLKDTGSLTILGTNAQFVQPNYITGNLPNGVLGGTVYDTSVNALKVYTGSSWDAVAAASTLVSHVNDTTIHFTESSINHSGINEVGSYTHDDIDTHIDDTTIHFTKSSILLGDLSDVVLTGSPLPAVNDVLTYAGSPGIWIHESLAFADLSELGDTIITLEEKGDLLVHNGTKWIDLTVGINDQILAADSTQATGVKWVTNAVVEVNDLTAAVTWANVPDINITETSVVQHVTEASVTAHEAALSIAASQITGETWISDITAEPISDLNDVYDTVVATTNRTALIADGTQFDARLLVEADISDLQSYALITDVLVENGFTNRTDSTISFTGSPREFTIAPVTTSFEYWSNAVKYIESSSRNVAVTDEQGIHAIYFDGATLVSEFSPTAADFESLIIPEYAFVAFVYWDVVSAQAVLIGDERHGRVMDSGTHLYLHRTVGTAYQTGLAMAGMSVDGNGSLDIHAQAGYASGIIWDEDIKHELAGVTAGDNIPILYMLGATAAWTKEDSLFTVLTAGTGRAAYNLDTAGTWTKVEVGNNNFVLTHYFATGNIDHPVVAIMGQNQYGNLSDARLGALTEITGLVVSDMAALSPEFTAISTIINQTSDSNSNTPKTAVRSTDTGDDYVDWREQVALSSGGSSATDHQDLAGLQGGSVAERYHLTAADAALVPTALQDITSEVIGDLSDVVLTGSPALAADDVLTYNGANWVNAVPLTSHLDLTDIGSTSHNDIDSHIADTTIHFDQLGELSDVVLTGSPTLVTGDVLTYNGANWVPDTPVVGVSELSDLSDVNTSTPDDKFVLVADGVDFESRLLVETDISNLGAYITELAGDASPTLAGNLDVGSSDIVSLTNLDIEITPNGTGHTRITNLEAPQNFNPQTGTAYTGLITDAGIMITMSNTGANTFTIPANGSVAYPVGTVLHVQQTNTGPTTVAIDTDTLNVNADLTKVLNGQYAVATCMKMTATTWVIFGNLVAS